MKILNLTLFLVYTSTLFSCNKIQDENYNSDFNKPIPIQKTNNFVYAAEQSLNSVVHIKSIIIENNIYQYYDPLIDLFYGNGYKYYNQPKEKLANGSGVIISEEGYIVTNNHVINNANEIEIVLNDKRVYKGNILGVDPTTDLALIKIDAEDLSPIKFANSDLVKVGEWVIAVGNPFNLNSTVTAGIISAKGRSLNLLKNPHAIESFLQTDAAINPGNSGGALVNTQGKLIGINTAIHSNTGSYTGYGFAIPSNMVQKIVNDIKKYGKVKRAFIGIQISEINSKISSNLNLKDNKGILVTKVIKGGAANISGMKDLDILISIEGIKINSIAELQEQISKYSPGDIIKCSVKRKNKMIELSLDLTEY